MIYRVIVTPRARADLLRLNAFLAEKSVNAALKAMDALSSRIKSLEHMPDRGISRSDGTRALSVSFGSSGYILEYRVDPDAVIISRIFHMREDRY